MPFIQDGIEKFRKDHLKMTRLEFAAEFDVMPNTVFRWELPKNKKPSEPMAGHFGKMFDLALDRGLPTPFYEHEKAPQIQRVKSLFEVEKKLKPKAILVVAGSLRVPTTDDERKTTEDNLKRGTQYCFVYPKSRQKQIADFESWLKETCNRISVDFETTIFWLPIDEEWPGLPAVFYLLGDPKEEWRKKVTGLLGDKMGQPIAGAYVTMIESMARSILDYVKPLVPSQKRPLIEEFLNVPDFETSVA